MKKYLSLLIVLFLSLGTLAGCSQETVYTGDGVSIKAKGEWVQAKTAEEYKNFFDDELPDTEGLKLALSKESGNGGYVTIEKFDATADIAAMDKFLNDLVAQAAANKDATIAFLQANSYTDNEISQIIPLLDGQTLSPEAKNYLYQTLYLQEWLFQMSSRMTDYQMNGVEDYMIDGIKTQVAQYQYKNATGNLLKLMETNVLLNNNFYVIVVWSDAKTFDKNLETYKNMMKSVDIVS